MHQTLRPGRSDLPARVEKAAPQRNWPLMESRLSRAAAFAGESSDLLAQCLDVLQATARAHSPVSNSHVKYTADFDAKDLTAGKCNCTWCTKRNVVNVHLKDKEADFKLISPKSKDEVGDYSPETEATKNDIAGGHRYFCQTCGVHVWGEGCVYEWANPFPRLRRVLTGCLCVPGGIRWGALRSMNSLL